ncbi:CCC motif membrane protein [Chitinophagaceae bacterium MMS25-I14]
MENEKIQPLQDLGNPQPLPNATAVLILGILSIATCCCYGIPGVICGVIALVLASKDMKLYNTSPAAYMRGSYNNLNGGRICAIIGLIISVLYLLLVIYMISMMGWDNLGNPEKMRAVMEQRFGK